MPIQNVSKLTAQLLAVLVLATGCSVNTPESVSSSSVNEDPVAAVDTAPTADPCAGLNANAAPCAGAVKTSAADTQLTQYFVDDSGLAIRGTDPVAYFTEGGPVAGSSEFAYTWNNATWQFASAENRDLFAANPEQYAPQYGGFCAWAVSQGYTAPIDPNAWSIVDNKLYLNYDKGVQRRWERDIPGNISKADTNWPGVLQS